MDFFNFILRLNYISQSVEFKKLFNKISKNNILSPCFLKYSSEIVFFVLLRLMVPVPSYCIVCDVLVCFLLEDICQLTIDWSSTAACSFFATTDFVYYTFCPGTWYSLKHTLILGDNLHCNLHASVNFSNDCDIFDFLSDRKKLGIISRLLSYNPYSLNL